MFDEFLRRIPQTVYVSATPDEWEYTRAADVVEQLVRPTGLVDPVVTIRPVKGQISDLEQEIIKRRDAHERVIVTTLTKQMAEDLTSFLKEKNFRVEYIHSDILTLERTKILTNLRKGNFDVIVGVNLLREGLDLPEVSLVAILDADKEGFLRSKVSLIQTMGRAARHIKGEVILYADTLTRSIRQAVEEVERRRKIQIAYNKKHNITPKGIEKPIRSAIATENEMEQRESTMENILSKVSQKAMEAMTPLDKEKHIKQLRILMQKAVKNMDFESAAILRDTIASLKHS